ncbi:MAG TPA: allantoate amidohydrolase [Thermomicrobiales bacterium]|nr:allantoate amidohydrolase [Thermomicrobiales bacterium]
MSAPSPISADTRAALLMARCDELARCTEVPGELTRTYASGALRDATALVAGWMAEAGMTTRTDVVGNLVGRYEADPAIAQPRTFLIGGHLDSVRNAGRYDGPLGVLTGIAFVQRLHAEGRRLPFAIEVIGFADEEGVRFHTSYLGSGTVAGTLAPESLAYTDPDGTTLADAMRAFGLDPDRLDEGRRDPGDLLGFVEVHIEQGPVLERQDLPVGVVTGIAGASRASIVFTGMAGHAGTVPMALRRDALAAAAEFVLAVERIANEVEHLVGTVGQVSVLPGASNVIPGRVELTLDVRHQSAVIREAAVGRMRDVLAELSARRRVEAEWIDVQGYPTVECDLDLMSRLIDAIADEGLEPLRLPSGAGHDAVPLSTITPVSMLFVRCKDGVSHNPAESIEAGDVAVAIRVLDRFINGIAVAVATSFQLED